MSNHNYLINVFVFDVSSWDFIKLIETDTAVRVICCVNRN